MRHILLLAIFAAAGVSAHAQIVRDVLCLSAEGTNALIYKAGTPIGTMDFAILNGTAPATPNPMSILSVKDEPGPQPNQIVWVYTLAEGREVHMTWQSVPTGNELTESFPVSAAIKRNGVELGKYPTCRWEPRR